MSGYLEGYGEQSQRKAKRIRFVAAAVFTVVVGGTALYFTFRDYPQERTVRSFLEKLRSQDYRGAYAYWGCTEQTPCPHYPFEEFLEDWGPQGIYRNAQQAEIKGTKSCETGLIQFVQFPNQPELLLWVERSNDNLSFAPWSVKTLPPGFKHRVQEWMWNVTRNCKPLIGP
ncbi:MAG TPA: hypothetical protein VEQ63_10605 [Bryobacteraceae bacterium]|nr:hypothetical protein [Bryobacteraceae bacterium]